MPTTILDNESYLEALQRRYVEESKNEENMKLIQMAEEACAPNQTFNSDEEWVKRFAALVAAHEREACAKVCDKIEQQLEDERPNKDFEYVAYDCFGF